MRRDLQPAFFWLSIILFLVAAKCAMGAAPEIQNQDIIGPGVYVMTAGGNTATVTVGNWNGTSWPITAITASGGASGRHIVVEVNDDGTGHSRINQNINGGGWQFGWPLPGGNILPGGDIFLGDIASGASGDYDYQSWLWAPAAGADCKARFRFENTRDYDVKLAIGTEADPDSLGLFTVAAGDTFDQVMDGDDGVECGVFYRMKLFVPATKGDGGWQEVPIDDGDDFDLPGEVEGETVCPSCEPDEELDPDFPPEAPTDGAQASGVIWKAPTPPTSDDERLDKATYRQGVDRQVAELKGIRTGVEQLHKDLTQTTVSNPGAAPKADVISASDIDVPDLKNLPEAPEFFTGSLTGSHVITATIPGFEVGGVGWPESDFEVDLSDYSTVITPFRLLLVVIITVGFFLLCLKTLRNACAN